MSKTKEKLDEKDNEALDFKYREREYDHELHMKASGLSSATLVNRERKYNGFIETHWNPIIKEIVVLFTWSEDQGEGDPSNEFNVVRAINNLPELIKFAQHA